jgi:geranylgeranyl diphosphate synthase type II
VPETAKIPESSVLAPLAREVDEYLDEALRAPSLAESLADAVRYALFPGGKRLRPALVLLSSSAVGGTRHDALAAAAAIELIHTFSLVHDDLPAMDDDALRRGRPTLHVHAGEAMAILAGDAMMSLAFELIGAAPIEAEKRVPLLQELALATTAMISGQVHDTIGGLDASSDAERLRTIHRDKTGALIRASCRMGAICGGATREELGALGRYGEVIGLMFQIVDDLLDVTQSTEHLGKRAGKDLPAGKLTWPGVFGIERSRADVARLRGEARTALSALSAAAEPLRTLADDLAVRTR